MRSGKYIKIVEDRYGEFASGVIANLLLLGHARVGDLAQAYFAPKDSKRPVNGAFALANSPLSRGLVTKKVDSLDSNHDPTMETLHQALYNLLQDGLVSAVNESHFRSVADNRSEAEKVVPFQDRYVGKLKKEQEAEREEAILNKLDDWKYGTKLEREELVGIRKGNKRPHEGHGDIPEAKRQRFHLPLTGNFMGETRHLGNLDVC